MSGSESILIKNIEYTNDRKTLVRCHDRNITSIEIPNSVVTIADQAFSNCLTLTSVHIPNSVTSIGDGAFRGCTSLVSVLIPDSVTALGDNAFNGCSKLSSITLSKSIKTLYEGTFLFCPLKQITIPSTTSINVSGHCFVSMDKLESISVCEGHTQLYSENGVLFNKNKTILIKYPPFKRDVMYRVPESVTSI